MPGVSFHVIRGFVEIADSRYVVLAMLAQHDTVVVDHDGRVPDRVTSQLVAFEDRRNDDHIKFVGELKFRRYGLPGGGCGGSPL